MKMQIPYLKSALLVGAAIIAMPQATMASAQDEPPSVSVGAMPLASALERIDAQTGTEVRYDPDAVRGLNSAPVDGALSALDAVRAATRGSNLDIVQNDDGSISVMRAIVVTAQRDEAEISLLVDGETTSSRTGLSLRDQPRNTTVISSRLMQEQQAQTVFDALRNAGGVQVNSAAVQGGVIYSVRGFGAGGVVNGLPAASNNGTAAGVTQPVAGVERIEVLKGPDALLAGANNLGGTINIVTKKPFAEELLHVSAETGSRGLARITVDANNALNDSGTISGRVVGTAATSDRNFGGYRGDEDYLFAPSLRFKNANTDVLLSVSASKQFFGKPAYVPVNTRTNEPFDLPRDQPIFSPDQFIRIGSTKIFGEITQNVGDWLTLVARGQHEFQTLNIASQTVFAVFPPDAAPEGTSLVSTSTNAQRGSGDAIDGYARIYLPTGPITHTLVLGATYVENSTVNSSSPTPSFSIRNVLNPGILPPIPRNVVDQFRINSSQTGLYGQYIAEFWRFHLIAGLRRNEFVSTINFFNSSNTDTDRGTATTPNFGAVIDILPNLTAYGSLVYGYSPIFATDFQGQPLPDIETRNLEGGIKLDLFGDRALLNLSYFELRQSNLIVPDRQNDGFNRAVPGQLGRGVDISLAGEIVRGLTAQANFTRTNFEYLTPSGFGDVVVGQPRDQYSLYASYRRALSPDVTGGLGGGVFGRSSAAADPEGGFFVPAALQVDLNAFLSVHGFDFNLGVRNVFDRVNYGITYSPSYVPYQEPRTWRLTVGHRF